MFKRNKDLIWCAVGAALFALFIFGLNRLNQPKQVTLTIENEGPPSSEHRFISDALRDADAVAEREESKLPGLRRADEASGSAEPKFPPQVSGQWERVSAPSMVDATLSESLERSLTASATLASEELSNPESATNLKRASELRETRTLRQASQN